MSQTRNEQIILNIQSYIEKNKLIFNNWKIIKNNTVLFSKKLLNYLLDDEIFENSYISIDDIYDYLSEKNTFEYFWLKEIFFQIRIENLNGYQIIQIIKNKHIKGQQLFTFTIESLLNDKFTDYDNLTFKVEDNFLDDERFGHIIKSKHSGSRVDIVIDYIKLVIEYDEPQHKSFDHSQADKTRDQIFNAYGYHVIRYNKQMNIITFMNNLSDIIKKRIFQHDPDTLENYITNIFIDQGFKRAQIEFLVKEQCIDIINGAADEHIGITPRTLTFNYLMQYINADEEYIEEFKENIDQLDEITQAYEITDNDIILSPNAFEYLMGKIDGIDYDIINTLHELYIKIKNTLINNIFKSAKEMIRDKESFIATIHHVTNDAYLRAEKDVYLKYRDQDLINKNQAETINILENYIKELLPHNGKGLQRKTANDTLSHSEGKSITKQIPELVYRKDKSKHISINAFKTLYKINSWKYHIPTCVTEYIKDIKKKLKCDNNELYNEIITNCELI